MAATSKTQNTARTATRTAAANTAPKAPAKGAKATVGGKGRKTPPKAETAPETAPKARAKREIPDNVWARRAAFAGLGIEALAALPQGTLIDIPDLDGVSETHVVLFGGAIKGDAVYAPSTYCPRVMGRNGKLDRAASKAAAVKLAALIKACAPADPSVQYPADPRYDAAPGAVTMGLRPWGDAIPEHLRPRVFVGQGPAARKRAA